MFERRVRIVLGVLIIAAIALVGRAMHLQIVQASTWQAIAGDTLRRSLLTETTRGRILDAKGRVLAADVPCNDAAVAYWFIVPEPDEQRLYDLCRKLARAAAPNYAELSRDEQHKLVLSLMPAARQQLEEMWETLAEVGNLSRAEIDETRRQIVERVEARRKHVIMARYREAEKVHASQDVAPWWRRWLLGEADAPPELADFDEPIAEELQAHVVLPNLSAEAYNELRKRQDDLPGLSLLASRTRHYPAGAAAVHVVGYLSAVNMEDLRADPEVADQRRAYLPRDFSGEDGLEKHAERSLRGTRGQVELDVETGQRAVEFEDVAGQDVIATIDAELQARVREAFNHVRYRWPAESDGREKEDVIGFMPGAAVLIRLRDGAILSMVSAPDVDPNEFEEEYPKVSRDEINLPLRNRATGFATIPGSTIKPVVGLAAIAEGVIGAHDTIECDGFLHYDGQKLGYLRCWTETMFSNAGINGHQNASDRHPTPGLNPGFEPEPGHLTLADALQRSCNIFFETLAIRMGEEKLNKWFTAFGLGIPTGCGLSEKRGLIPADMPDEKRREPANVWMTAVGQGYIQATPLQMANVAATLARGGVFIRPTLLAEETKKAVAEKRDLGLDPQGLDMVRRGMEAAVQTPGGSGWDINASLPVEIAGKTGSAQASPLTIPLRDAEGNLVPDEHGKVQWVKLRPSTRDYTNPAAPWFRRVNPVTDGEEPRQAHGWFIGYAPADNPQVAFAVLVEYGGSGGVSAGSVVTQIINALAELGYIEPTRQPVDDFDPANPRYKTERPAW